jgi:EAL domain-containing protein (putative c-di-GMP-specific phosphodiesterase class I)
VDAADGNLRAVEALIRWTRPEHGKVFPDEFIPVAEASDLIIELDRWVLRTAARQATAWAASGELGTGTAMSVNVSGRHLLSERLHDHVREVLADTGLDPRRLVLEITETVLLTDIPTAAMQLDAVRALGVRVAVDDFGTGYTSLAALQGLPIDTIKVDRSFVSGIHEAKQQSLVALVTQLGHQLGVTVVAEGVETEEQLSTLRSLGCDEIQGYFISRPVPEPELRSRFTIAAA